MSIKVRISLLFALIVTIILLLLNTSVYYFTSVDRRNNFKKRLKNRTVSTTDMYMQFKNGNLDMLHRMDSVGGASLYEKSVLIQDLSGNRLYSYDRDNNDSVSFDGQVLEKAKFEKEYYFNAGNKEGVSVLHDDNESHFVISLAAHDTDGFEKLNKLKNILLVSFLGGILAALFMGYLFALRLVRPISNMARQAGLITTSNLSSRIETNNPNDELHHLAASFNNLLDRLQESFQIQRRFISNASHELSTPLTSVSSQLEVTLQKERTPEEYKKMILSVQEDVLQLQQLTRSLLEIAKTGRHGSIDLNEVRIDEVIIKVASDVKKQNPDCNIKLDFGEFPDDERLLEVFGNADLLYSAFRNIVENGCKYSDDKTATVNINYTEKKITLKISSKGDIIAEADIQNIFEPFFRTGPALAKPGFGLGLTLAKRIISLHKGSIDVTSDPETGTIFTISLPSILDFK